MNYIKSIDPLLLSSNYGDGNVLGQPLGVKTLGIVRIELNSGHIGFGESYIGIYVPELFREIVNYYGKILINSEMKSPSQIFQDIYIPFCSRNGLMASVYAAIDIALWDVFCKVENNSFAEINNLKTNKNKKLYWSGGSAAFSPSKIREEVYKLDHKIFQGYKLRIGKQSWLSDKERIKAAKDNLSHNNLMIDAIMGSINPPWEFRDWLNKNDFINSISPYWLEEPLNPDNIKELTNLKKIINCKIATGEAITGILELQAYIESDIDVLQLDFTHLGGPSAFLKSRNEIETSGKMIAMHIWGSPLAFNVNAYIGMCIENCEWIEYPSVSLEISGEIDKEYFLGRPSLVNVEKLVGFIDSKISFLDFIKYKFVPNSGFNL